MKRQKKNGARVKGHQKHYRNRIHYKLAISPWSHNVVNEAGAFQASCEV